MILCAAVDDNMGMTFHQRRQSSDRLLRSRLLELSQGTRLWMNAYTAKQFEHPLAENIIEDENFMEKAGEEDFCFAENTVLNAYQKQIKKIILFRWNRRYPADTYFDIPLTENGWKRKSAVEFAGNSHPKITMEEWER